MDAMRIATCVVGQVSTNCYILYGKDGEAVIVDPGDNARIILNKCRELGVTPEAILLTHGHFDHILAVEDIKRSFPVKVYASVEESRLMESPTLNISRMFQKPMSLKADVIVREGETVETAGFCFRVIATPGHTAGSVCYLEEEEEVLLSGDTLFAESLGRTDLPTGSSSQIISSITEKLFELPDNIMVYPGHGEPTTIGHEKMYNPVAAYRG